MTTKKQLKSKIALVTGAGRGIGRAVMEALATEGCVAVGAARSENELKELCAGLAKKRLEADFIAADLSDPAAAASLVNTVIKRHKRIDILVNNAGLLYRNDILEVTEEEFDTTMTVNVKSMLFLCQHVLKDMMKRKSGHIVNVSSTVALGVPPHLATYGISKHAVVGLTQALYETAKLHGVKVNCVYPGITDTKMVRDLNPGNDGAEWMQPEDIADIVVFLLKQSRRAIVRDIVPWSTRHDRI
jgi:NAD(P)-dependent dehydrogenase (short-subunit alcohol dehydrogenase family)